MWVLVLGSVRAGANEGNAASVLTELGCKVTCLDFFDSLEFEDKTPNLIVVEARGLIEAARAASIRLRGENSLQNVPILWAVEVSALTKLKPEDDCDDLTLYPYVPAELYARIRRLDWKSSGFAHAEALKAGAIYIDLSSHEVRIDNQEIALTPQEFALLAFLVQNRGRVYSRSQLLTRVWNVEHYGDSRTVDIHVRRLRSKMGSHAHWIETVRGIGYKFRDQSLRNQTMQTADAASKESQNESEEG